MRNRVILKPQRLIKRQNIVGYNVERSENNKLYFVRLNFLAFTINFIKASLNSTW
jgi:hypothetical protein